MSFHVTRAIPRCPVPDRWRIGATSAAIDRLISGLLNPRCISPTAAKTLALTVIDKKYRRILEFGAGMSSRILAAAIDHVGGGQLTSVEQYPQWCADAWAAVEKTSRVDAKLVEARVRLTIDSKGIYYGYDNVADIAERGPYDLVFIDAPLGIFGRDGALHAAYRSLSVGGTIVLDDAARLREQRTLRRWMLNYPDLSLIANDNSIGKGIAMLHKEGVPVTHARRFEHIAEVWGSGIYETIRTAKLVRQQRVNEAEMRTAQ